jgi:excisionase family DNA binding protein
MPRSRPLLSPNEFAKAIGVSESTMKRWVDRGEVRAVRTLGGHRRIPVHEAVRFIRVTRHPVVDPRILGMSEAAEVQARSPDVADADALYHALKAEDHQTARGIIFAAFLAGTPLAHIADDLVRPAMEDLGALWRHDATGILLEHRATDTCIQIINQLRGLIQPAPDAPAAVGAGAPGDPYVLGSLTAAATLADEGLNAVNLGPDTPLAVLAAAAARYRAVLVWLSLSSEHASHPGTEDLEALCCQVGAIGARLVLGGRALPSAAATLGERVFVGRSMRELAAFAGGLLGRGTPR